MLIGFLVFGGAMAVITRDVSAWADSFAPFASIASALALLLALWTVTIQRQELEETRKELNLQWIAQQTSAKAQTDSAELAKAQILLAKAQLLADITSLTMHHFEVVTEVIRRNTDGEVDPVTASVRLDAVVNGIGKQIQNLAHLYNQQFSDGLTIEPPLYPRQFETDRRT